MALLVAGPLRLNLRGWRMGGVAHSPSSCCYIMNSAVNSAMSSSTADTQRNSSGRCSMASPFYGGGREPYHRRTNVPTVPQVYFV